MASMDQVIGQLRFHLEQLNAQNAHHEFEHICRHIARARIYSNVLPATGPISAGGDQGRDFETFRTHLSGALSVETQFVGLASGAPVAFACTLTEASRVKAKVKSDVESIVGQGQPVSEVHFFCTADVPVRKRHDLQEWAEGQHEVLLEIHDGQAIAELLSGRDVFWIAERFLNVAGEVYPPPPEGTGAAWYDESLEEWKERQTEGYAPTNYADFSEIKAAIRFATFEEKAKGDMSFWIGLLDTLREKTGFSILERKATYEMAVAKLRGQGSLHQFEDDLREYFSGIRAVKGLGEIEDASVLLTYMRGAFRRGLLDVSVSEYRKWDEDVQDLLSREISKAEGPARKCTLLLQESIVGFFPDSDSLEEFDWEALLRCWEEALELIEDTPLAPLERLSDYITLIIEMGLSHPQLDDIAARTDELLAQRQGRFAAAEKSRDRAVAYQKHGRLLQAAHQLHGSKIDWFADETLRGSVLSCLLLSNTYLRLGLTLAARRYAFVAAYVALHSPEESLKDLVPGGLFAAADAAYKEGAWCTFFNGANLALQAFSAYENERLDSPDAIDQTLFHSATAIATSAVVAPSMRRKAITLTEHWGRDEEFAALQPIADDTWAEKPPEEIQRATREEGCGTPWSDTGLRRSAHFEALGVAWKFEWENTYGNAAAAESLVSAFQVVLAALAKHDLCLLPTTVEISLQFSGEWEYNCSPRLQGTGLSWQATVPSLKAYPPDESMLDRENIIMGLVTQLAGCASALKREEFIEIVEAVAREGLFTQAFFGAPYSAAFKEFVEEKVYREWTSSKRSPASKTTWALPTHESLDWQNGVGPFYSEDTSKEMIANRYHRCFAVVRYTLPRLMEDEDFSSTVEELREGGWLDWHILMAVANIVVNYRSGMDRVPRSPNEVESQEKRIVQMMNEPEAEGAPRVPRQEFSKKRLKQAMEGTTAASLRAWGHDIHHPAIDSEAISEFLGDRYNHWTDDIEHESFAAFTEGGHSS